MSNILLKISCLVTTAFVILSGYLSLSAACELKADRVLVNKTERKLYLLNDGQVMKEYPISLGLNPVGHKQQQGDKRTPEGTYLLKHRNPQSKYYKSILLSYPNEQDRRRAEARGVDPGGDLAIHGLPTRSEEEAWDYIERDWTDGCIAVTNDEMEEIWNMVDDGTPIEILP
jgi:murein L,D-transpeptidase YafK